MANIQMEYRKYSCDFNQGEICVQCFTSAASDLGCPYFHDGKDKDREEFRVPYGACIHAVILTNYKGITTKSYEMEHIVDPYTPDEYMLVKIRGKYYECDKVILDGVKIYPDEEVK